MPGEPLDQLRDQLDPGACRLANLPGRVWLLGGKGGFRSGMSEPCESLRESFWRQSLASPPSAARSWVTDLDIPENHAGWWAFSGYDDLLTVERDACHLARTIILFPESPGSLAELGALAVDDAIVNRLLVVVQSEYLSSENRESFLNLGPLRRAEALGNRCVVGARSSKVLPAEDFDEVMEFVDAWLPHRPSTEKLRLDVPTHRLLLIADLVDLLLISRLAELHDALQHFGMSVTLQELERAAKLLEFFGLIRVEPRGFEHFLSVARRPIEHGSTTPPATVSPCSIAVASSWLVENCLLAIADSCRCWSGRHEHRHRSPVSAAARAVAFLRA